MVRFKRIASIALGTSLLLLGRIAGGAASEPQEHVQIDARAQATPFPHFWEQMFGSGRAILMLRDSYRDDLRAVKQITDWHRRGLAMVFRSLE
jgi:xylan 1,4-beta-xylosidase